MIEMFRELLRKVLHTFCFYINQFESMLSEHSSGRLCFLIRKGGKNADLIGKESLHRVYVYMYII